MNKLTCETLRYMGCNESIDENVILLVNKCIDEIYRAAAPRSIYQVFDIIFENDYVNIATLKLNSKALYSHLQQCSKAVIFAATLGAEVDRVIRTASITDMSQAVIYQAAAAAIIEEYCDNICDNELINLPQLKNLHLTSRFSPGYGDLSLDFQPEIINILNCKKIGLSCTQSLMLAPSKSVTAFIGAGDKVSCVKHKCSECTKTDCLYRKGNR